MKFVELCERYPDAVVRFSNKRAPYVAIGVHDPGDGANYLYIYEDGVPQRMLSNRENRALLVDVHDDWHVSNQ